MLNVSTNYNQAISLIDNLKPEEKIDIYNYISRQTLKSRLEQLRLSLKDIPVSFDEITAIVEEVRQERYESNH